MSEVQATMYDEVEQASKVLTGKLEARVEALIAKCNAAGVDYTEVRPQIRQLADLIHMCEQNVGKTQEAIGLIDGIIDSKAAIAAKEAKQ